MRNTGRNRLKGIMKNRRGSTYISSACVIIALSAVIGAIFSFCSAIRLCRNCRTEAERILDGFVVEKSIQIYGDIKQCENFFSADDEQEFKATLYEKMKLDAEGCRRDDEGAVIFRLSDVVTEWETEGRLCLRVKYTYTMRLKMFAGGQTLSIPMAVTSKTINKF